MLKKKNLGSKHFIHTTLFLEKMNLWKIHQRKMCHSNRKVNCNDILPFSELMC